MTMNHIRVKIQKRKRRKCRITEKAELFQIPVPVSIRLVSGKIIFIVYKVVKNPVHFLLQHTDITGLSHIVHVKVRYILQVVPVLFLHTHVLGNHDSGVKIVLIHLFGKRAHYICKTSGFDKGYRFRRQK